MGRTLQFATPRVFEPALKPSRYKGLFGGRGGMKSHTFAELLLDYALSRPPLRAVCVREVQASLEQSVKRLLEDKIKAYDLGHEFRVMNTHIDTPGGGIFIFNGMQNHTAESIKSLEGYHVAWVEEAQSLSKRSLNLLRPTIREDNSELWFSWNPRHETDPVDEMLRKNPPPGSIVIQSSWRDNPWFPDVLRQEMEWDRLTDPDKYAHIWEGGYEKHSEARVFKNWRVEEFEAPSDAFFKLGADWGYSTDPSTLVRLHDQEPTTQNGLKRKTIFIDHEVYRIGVEIDYMPQHFDGLLCGCKAPVIVNGVLVEQPQPCRDPHLHGWARNWEVVADSARPETISYMQRHGYPRTVASVKGANSVKEGVIFLQGYDIVIHPRCVHTIDEFTMYSYVVDKLTGVPTNVLEDKKNHVIDPVRYAVEKLRSHTMSVVKLAGF